MRRELSGKRVILTGASSGIGRAVALALTAAGAKVAVAARSADKLADLAKNQPVILPVTCDVTNPADRERLIAAAVAQWGGIDILINNAGVGAWGHFATSTDEINRQILEVNFFAPLELTRLALPHLAIGHQSVVVNVTSMCGRRGMPAWPEYSASKFALVGMCEAFRGEFVRFGVEVVTIVPGLTKSEYNQHLIRNEGKADIRFDHGMEPAYVAKKIVDAIRRNKTEVILGGEAKKMLLFNKFAPRLLNRLIARNVTRLYQ